MINQNNPNDTIYNVLLSYFIHKNEKKWGFIKSGVFSHDINRHENVRKTGTSKGFQIPDDKGKHPHLLPRVH